MVIAMEYQHSQSVSHFEERSTQSVSYLDYQHKFRQNVEWASNFCEICGSPRPFQTPSQFKLFFFVCHRFGAANNHFFDWG